MYIYMYMYMNRCKCMNATVYYIMYIIYSQNGDSLVPTMDMSTRYSSIIPSLSTNVADTMFDLIIDLEGIPTKLASWIGV